jgi:ParB family chromosome partitioning protein
MKNSPERIEMIPIDFITVPNPRVRNPKIHRDMTDSIEKLGLKRPITVRRIVSVHDREQKYALVCGQGRMESCQMLGQKEIAAVIVDVDAETGHVMSIVENVARRLPRANEMLEQVGSLKRRGYNDVEIAAKIGCTPSWVNNVTYLLAHGEKRLLAAAGAGHISLHLAASISRANDEDAQRLLLEAYEKGDLKGKNVTAVRLILDQRSRIGKSLNNSFTTRNSARRHMTTEDLRKIYLSETQKHKLNQKKAEHTQSALLLAQQIFKELFASEDFCSVLKSEKLISVPLPLAELARRGGYLS